LGIVRSQIKIERIFSLVGMHTNFWRCHLHTDNLERLIFVSKNWQNNFRISSFPTNLVKFVEANVNLKEELKSLRDLLMDMKLWTCEQIFYVIVFIYIFHFDIYFSFSFSSLNNIFLTKYVKFKLLIFRTIFNW